MEYEYEDEELDEQEELDEEEELSDADSDHEQEEEQHQTDIKGYTPSFPLTTKYKEGTEKLAENPQIWNQMEQVNAIHTFLAFNHQNINPQNMTLNDWKNFLIHSNIQPTQKLYIKAMKLLMKEEKANKAQINSIRAQKKYTGPRVKFAPTKRIFQQAIELVMNLSDLGETKNMPPEFIKDIIYNNKYHISKAAIYQLRCFTDLLIINLFKSAKLIANTRRKQDITSWIKDNPEKNYIKHYYRIKDEDYDTADLQKNITKIPEKTITPKDIRAAVDISFIMRNTSASDMYDKHEWVANYIPQPKPRKSNKPQPSHPT